MEKELTWRPWTEKEINFIKEWANSASDAAIAAVLNRSARSVKTRRCQLGLMHAKPADQAQPCWSCKWATNPIGNPCSWSARLKPVKGWDAEFIVMRAQGERLKPMKSFKIRHCPLFKEG